jgi:predicted PhzF superfamily epimerase YddE/YHI9
VTKLEIFQVDAFADRVFKGNPAAICPLDTWLDDSMLQNIAAENNRDINVRRHKQTIEKGDVQ